jgi:biotin synthase
MITTLIHDTEADSSESFVEALAGGDYSRETLREGLLARGSDQEKLFALARERRDAVWPAREVETRSVIELSNVCQQSCNYCSMAKESKLKRYVIKIDPLMEQVDFLYSMGRRVVLLQSGENDSDKFVDYAAKCCAEIKRRHPDLEIILCMGNLSHDQYVRLKAAGADRYILKFESSSPTLYATWKPSDTLDQRLACLQDLINIGFKVGTGNMVGMPGQSLDDVIDDLLILGKYDLSMMSCTVFIPGEMCNYHDQPMGDVEIALNQMALMRIMYPKRLMPTTSCLERGKPGGQLKGLMAGANTVTIHDGTPEEFKKLFPIYSTDRCSPGFARCDTLVKDANLSFGKAPLI